MHGRLFLHQNEQQINCFCQIIKVNFYLSLNKYQDISPYTVTIIQVNFVNPSQLDTDYNYILRDRSKLIGNNPYLKCYPTLISKDSVCNNVVPLIISKDSDNKVCLFKDAFQRIS